MDAVDYFAHPTALIEENVAIGAGCKIWHYSHIMRGSVVGANCNIGRNVLIGPQARVGAGCKIQNNINIFQGIELEDDVFCGPGMVFTNVLNPRAFIPRMHELRPTLVKKGASLGANCTIVCGNVIGGYALVGAGAVVTRDVPAYALVTGNPARCRGWVCRCGVKLTPATGASLYLCPACGLRYKLQNQAILKKL
jgi:UDP-2-acetamido-3-amino-2,3-dideoxy-glucuronate N-acetyltransferase